MARPKPETFDKAKTVAENRRARFDYAIEEKFEAGLALQGTEVKALRAGEASIAESYAEVRDGQVWRGRIASIFDNKVKIKTMWGDAEVTIVGAAAPA